MNETEVINQLKIMLECRKRQKEEFSECINCDMDIISLEYAIKVFSELSKLKEYCKLLEESNMQKEYNQVDLQVCKRNVLRELLPKNDIEMMKTERLKETIKFQKNVIEKLNDKLKILQIENEELRKGQRSLMKKIKI